MLRCAMCSSELIFFAGELLFFIAASFCCRKIGGFPPCLCALGSVNPPPILIGAGELLRDEHGLCCIDDKRHVYDGVICAFPFGLGIFQVVYVLGYELTI